jgi:adenylate cyclase
MTLIYNWTDDREATAAEARELGRRALALAPDDPTVLVNAAVEMMVLEPEADLIRLFDRALELNPGEARTWAFSGWARVERAGDHAIEQFETALRRDPISPERPTHLGGLALAHLSEGRFEEAVALARAAAQLRDSWPLCQAVIAVACAHLGRFAEAREAIARHRALTPVHFDDWAATWAKNPILHRLILDGIALVEAPA